MKMIPLLIAGLFACTNIWAADPAPNSSVAETIACEGSYPHHLQGVAADQEAIYWSFTTTLVKTDRQGKVQQKIPVVNHHGDLCLQGDQLYVAVNLGKFNDPEGNAQSWIYVYDKQSLKELAKHAVPEVFYGAGGIAVREGHFYVVGGLPGHIEENYIYEYDPEFQFQKKHVLASGQTHLGIQTATFFEGKWYFGCYGNPSILLVADEQFQLLGRYKYNCSLGIEAASEGLLFSATGRCQKETGCTGAVKWARPDSDNGLVLITAP